MYAFVTKAAFGILIKYLVTLERLLVRSVYLSQEALLWYRKSDVITSRRLIKITRGNETTIFHRTSNKKISLPPSGLYIHLHV